MDIQKQITIKFEDHELDMLAELLEFARRYMSERKPNYGPKPAPIADAENWAVELGLSSERQLCHLQQFLEKMTSL